MKTMKTKRKPMTQNPSFVPLRREATKMLFQSNPPSSNLLTSHFANPTLLRENLLPPQLQTHYLPTSTLHSLSKFYPDWMISSTYAAKASTLKSLITQICPPPLSYEAWCSAFCGRTPNPEAGAPEEMEQKGVEDFPGRCSCLRIGKVFTHCSCGMQNTPPIGRWNGCNVAGKSGIICVNMWQDSCGY